MLEQEFAKQIISKKYSKKNIRINSDVLKLVGLGVVIIILVVVGIFAFSSMVGAIEDRNEKIDNLQTSNPTWKEPPVEETNKPNNAPTWNEPPKSESNVNEPSKDSTSNSETTIEVIDLRDKSKSNNVVVEQPFIEPTGEVVDLRNNDKSSSLDVIEDDKEGLVAPPGGW